jgi:hypothetical protein
MAQFNELTPHRACRTAGTAFGKYTRVKLSGSTANTIAQAVAGEPDIGVVSRQTFSTDTQVDVILAQAPGTVPMVVSGAVTANALVYPDVSGQVTATPNGSPLGRALVAGTNAGDIIEVSRFPFLGTGKIYSAVAASTAITNTTTETLFSSQFSIPANTLQAGDVLRVFFQGIATATNSTDTLAIKLYIGGLAGTALLTLAARDVANNDIFQGRAEIVIRTNGASGTFVAAAEGPASPNAGGTAWTMAAQTGSTAIDTTAAQVIGVSATWSVANAGDSCRLDILDIFRS